MCNVNYELPIPISALVQESFLYDDKPNKNNWVECKIIALNFYPGEASTLTIILNDGSMFDYCPLHFLKHRSEDDPDLSLKDLSYNNTVSAVFSVIEYEYMKKKPIYAYIKGVDKWFDVRQYICSIDWIYDNDKKHFCILSNGAFATLPNHKIKIGVKELSFKPYKKISETFKI